MNPDNPQDQQYTPPTNPTQPPSVNPLSAMQPGEREIFHIKRHPIGIIATYVIAGLMLLVLAVLLFVAGPSILSGNKDQVNAVGAIVFAIGAVVIIAFSFISNIVYWGNAWILTDDSITQVRQNGLFDKQSSQLSLENLEDVTAEQNGILTHLFNYGVLKAETAGERSKFMFIYCPNPNYYAKMILEAREQFMQQEVRSGGTNINSEA